MLRKGLVKFNYCNFLVIMIMVFETKIHEALSIKKHNPGLNRQLFANVSSFLLIYCRLLLPLYGFAWCIDFATVICYCIF